MLAVAADEARADRSETTDCHVTHRGVLVDVAVRAKVYVSQRAMRIDGGVTVKSRIEDRAAIFNKGSFPERRPQDVTISPDLNLISVEPRLHNARPKPNPDVPVPAFILCVKNQAFEILNQTRFIRG